MADIIQLLPDAIANQIAAGEVVQRPASVVKELMENALDAGAMTVKLIVKEAGKSLIQVIDDGSGMSETDARMAFERHATSKIKAAKDLFSIKTMGFRGEALASIAAIAHVTLKTRKEEREMGVNIQNNGSEIIKQEPCQAPVGTSIAVKNLFYNVPARRNFLKSNAAEMNHIIEEFTRISMAHPDVFFSLHHNDNELFHLPKSGLKQRIVNILGGKTNQNLVPVHEETDALIIDGYVGKPEFATKSRGKQYLYINNRFIKSGYINHAIMGAYEGLIPSDHFPFYVLFIEIDPARIDVNVHPTKQEIKFEDERLVYNYTKVAIRHGLGKHNITPTIDFEQSGNFSSIGNPFIQNSPTQEGATYDPQPIKGGEQRHENNLQNWQKMYDGLTPAVVDQEQHLTMSSGFSEATDREDETIQSKQGKAPYQIHQTYIISQIKSGFVLIDQRSASERILYERYLGEMSSGKSNTQKSLFPRTISYSPADSIILQSILPKINSIGFDIQEFGKDAYIVHGYPAEMGDDVNQELILEQLIDQFKRNVDFNSKADEIIAQTIASKLSLKKGVTLEVMEMEDLINKLFACEMPFVSPSGKNCFITFELDEIQKKFAQ